MTFASEEVSLRLSLFALLGLLLVLPASAQQPAPPTPNAPPAPNNGGIGGETLAPPLLGDRGASATGGPPLVLDMFGDNVGLAQQAARDQGLQARILWMDAGANVGSLNSPEKIADIVSKTKACGMNMIVLDVKPIVGETVYPSAYAPKLTMWKGQTVAADFDVLGQMLSAAHAAGLPVYANMSTFGEGHKLVGRGLAYAHPDWQTVLYDVDRTVARDGTVAPIAVTDALPPGPDALAALTDTSLLHADRPGCFAAILNFDARVVAVQDGATLAAGHLQIPPRGSALLGSGASAEWLRRNAPLGQILTFHASPKYLPVAAVPEQKYTLFVDPANPAVRQHEWDIVREIVTRYPVDGVVFDDRLRYAAQTADFGPNSRAAFEASVGHPVAWPDDVFRLSPYPGQDILPGPLYHTWLAWRAGNITSWLTEATRIVRTTRPAAQVAVYVGSWYGDYEKVGSNWAGPDFQAPYAWLTPDYRKTAYAGLLDWLTTGCYYPEATLADAVAARTGDPGATVEGAGQVSNRVAADACWTYAGLYAAVYKDHPEQFARAIAAAGASTQGVMVFDLSQIVDYDWWHVLAEAFAAAPAAPPNLAPGLLDDVRRQRAVLTQQGIAPPPLPPFTGIENTGF